MQYLAVVTVTMVTTFWFHKVNDAVTGTVQLAIVTCFLLLSSFKRNTSLDPRQEM